MQALARPKSSHRLINSSADRRSPPREGSQMGFAVLALLASLASCDSCTERTPGVCCTSDEECSQLGLPHGSASDYSCGQGLVCRDFYCMPAEALDASRPDTADASSGRCNPNAPFGAPTRLANVNSQFEDLSVAMTFDQLKAYFGRSTGNSYVIVSSKRDSINSDFLPPASDPTLAAINAGAGYRTYLNPASDDLVVYYRRDTTWVASHRLDSNNPFDVGTEVYVDGSPLLGFRTTISADSRTIYYSSPSAPLRTATQGSAYYIFGNNRAATIFDLTDFAISADELTLYYSNYPNPDIFRTTRSSKNVPFDVGLPVPNVNTTGADIPLYISPNDCFLYLRATDTGSTLDNDIWVARRGQ
jgi:hypothetical protein